MDSNLKSKTISNMLWRLLEQCGAQGVSFIVSIVLARLLTPSDYGTISLITVFTTVLQVFVNNGLPVALIQKSDADTLDFSTVFWYNLVICLFIYMGIFWAAPIIAVFYSNEDLTSLVRVLSLTILISGFKSVQQSYVSKHLLFRKFFFSTIGGTIFSAVVGITMAYMGYGYWAIVAQQLSNIFIDTLILWFTVKWRPEFTFSFDRLKDLFSYGWKLLFSSLIDTGYNNLRSLIIGKVYSSSDLAFYNKGQQFPSLIITNINTSIDSVLLPVMSSVQDNVDSVKNMTRKSIKMSSYLMWPLMIGLAVCAKPLVLILLTEKWLDSVFFLRVFCFTYVLWPMHTSNLNAIKSLGRSDLFLKLEIIKKFVGFISIIISVPFGVRFIAIAYLITGPINALVNAYPNKKILNYSIKEQIEDLMPYIALSLAMGSIIWPIQYLPIGNFMIIMIQVALGGLFYVIGSMLFQLDVFFELFNLVKKNIRK